MFDSIPFLLLSGRQYQAIYLLLIRLIVMIKMKNRIQNTEKSEKKKS